MESSFYVYGHYISGSDVPFYIGKGTGRRAYHKYDRSKFWKSLVTKYGGYDVKILYENLTNEEALAIEKQLIAQHGRRDLTTGYLVNQTDGGDGVSGHSPLSIQRIVKNRIGKPLSDVHKKKISEALKGRTVSDSSREKIRTAFLGKKRPQEVIEKMRVSLKGKGGKAILQFDLDNTFIKEYNTIQQAATENGLCQRSIRRVLKGQFRQTRGFIFKYK
jgi:hypothetical protein